MKKTTIIIAAIVAALVLAVVLVINFPNGKPADQSEGTSESTESSEPTIVIPPTDNPDETDVPDDPTDPSNDTTEHEFDPNDPIGNGDIARNEINDDPSVKVVDSTVETEKKDVVVDEPTPADDTVKPSVKEQDVVQTGEVAEEIINDTVIEEKEKAEKERKEEEQKEQEKHPAVVVEEKTTTETPEEKPPVIVEEKDITPSGNEPVYVDPTKGEHPDIVINNGTPTEDNAEDFIGEDRLGEGIHF